MSSIADMYGELRQLTVKQLGIEIATPADEVKVNRVVALKLELDRLQSMQLRGEAIDARVLVEVSEQLEAALRPAHAAPETRFSSAHQQKLRALIERTLAENPDEVARLADVQAREERTMADEAAGRPPEPVPVAVPPPCPREEPVPAWWGSAVVLGPWGCR